MSEIVISWLRQDQPEALAIVYEFGRLSTPIAILKESTLREALERLDRERKNADLEA